MRVQMVAIERVKPYARNPRLNDGAAVAKVAGSLREFGWQQPIVVDADFVVIAGHTRLKAAQSLGMEQVPVHVAKTLTPAQVQAYRIADNRVGEEAEWDRALLNLELGEIKEAGGDLISLGFDDNELASLLGLAVDPAAEWQGMPEFDQPDATAFRDIVMHFPDQAAVDAFQVLIGQTVTDKTKFLWYPEAERGTYADKRYASDAGEGVAAPAAGPDAEAPAAAGPAQGEAEGGAPLILSGEDGEAEHGEKGQKLSGNLLHVPEARPDAA